MVSVKYIKYTKYFNTAVQYLVGWFRFHDFSAIFPKIFSKKCEETSKYVLVFDSNSNSLY